MSIRSLLPLPFIAAIVLALAALGGTADTVLAEDAAPDAADTVFLEMRIWQHVDDADNIWISARPRGGRWDTLGTVPFPLDREAGSYSAISRHRYRDLAIAGVGFRVWQRVVEPERIYVQSCAEACPERAPGAKLIWRPLGMIPLSLDSGHSTSGALPLRRPHHGGSPQPRVAGGPRAPAGAARRARGRRDGARLEPKPRDGGLGRG